MNYTAAQIARLTGATLMGEGAERVAQISFDSRNIFSADETAFIAINTGKNNGEKFIPEAIEKGIRVIIAEKKSSDLPGITWILVKNTVQFLQNLAKVHLENLQKNTIGITGSNGKTIVKEWLYQSLWDEFRTVKSPKSFNSQIGLPLSILGANTGHELGIFEAGISKPGEMQHLAEIFSPEIGVLTHIGSAHRANFENEEQLINEKIKLFKNSRVIIFNGDNELVSSILATKYPSKKLISYGLNIANDLHIASDWQDRSVPLRIKYFNESIEIQAKQRDEATLNNALAVIAVLKELGISNEKIIRKIDALQAVEMRLDSVNGVRNNLVINDSFNLDTDSLKIAFQFIKEYKKPNKVLIITDFVEGQTETDFYEKIAKLANEQDFDKIFLVGDEIINYAENFNAETHSFKTTRELIDSEEIRLISNSLILLKGARKFEIEKVKSRLELQKHDTVLEVNLNAILHNIHIHKALLDPKTKMMAMVKAFSYGLGGYEIAEFLQHHHIDYLGVAYADEGVDLRKNGITAPVMVMNPEQHSYDAIIEYNLEPEIYSFRVLELFHEALVKKGANRDYPVHIKLETGMHRLGFKEDELEDLAKKIRATGLRAATVFSHLSTADMPEEQYYTRQQLATFERESLKLTDLLGYAPIRHILNSSGIVHFPEYQFDMVRIGIGMMGISSDEGISSQLQSAVTFKTVISQISRIKSGESVGYGRRFIAKKDSTIATIPVGYADGIRRSVGNGVASVGIAKRLFPVAGSVCMDMMMIDLGDFDAKEGDEVVIFNGNPSLSQFAKYCDTIPYEVLTSISRRVKRIYIKN